MREEGRKERERERVRGQRERQRDIKLWSNVICFYYVKVPFLVRKMNRKCEYIYSCKSIT